jgi:hypothetical protein
MSYNPKPTRVWSRVQHPCTFTVDSSYNSIFDTLTGKTTTPIVAQYYNKLLYKGNILQYKKNSSTLTKSQKYSQICKGMWTNRTKSYATQNQTYTNPNTSNLQQVNFINVPSNGATPNIPGPYNFNIPTPYGCPSDTAIKEGGSLLCNTVVNPCTNEVINVTKVLECYPTYYSDVPGPVIDLCWNSKLDTWYPRQNLTMNNSTDKWPEGYKGFVSGVSPGAPYLMIDVSGNIATLTWKIIFNDCIPISSFNIYENGQIIANVPYPTKSYNVLLNCITNDFYVTTVSTTIESGPSNTVRVEGIITYNITSLVNTSYTVYSNNGYTGIVFDNNNSTTFTTGTALINFCKDVNNASILIVGGGGGGGAGDREASQTHPSGGAAGSGAAITYLTNYTISGSTNINLTIGFGGAGRTPGNQGQGAGSGQSGTASLFSTISSGGGGAGSGIGGSGAGPAGSSNSNSGGGGGGGGGAYRLAGLSGTPGVTVGGSGGSGLSGVNPGTNGSNASYGVGFNGGLGGASGIPTVTLPFTPSPVTLNLGGGGGGGGSVSGGGAGNGTGGAAGTNTLGNYYGANALYGIANSAYGGGGGGGGIDYTGNTNIGGNGGNGTVIIWWTN